DVVMVSPVDPYYGIRVTRRVQLDPAAPVMRIVTTYDRVSGEPAKIGVWVITQLQEPEVVIIPLRGAGYTTISKDPPPGLNRKFSGTQLDILTVRRDPKAPYKIGCRAGTLIWVGEDFMLRIDAPRVPGAEYPDQSS